MGGFLTGVGFVRIDFLVRMKYSTVEYCLHLFRSEVGFGLVWFGGVGCSSASEAAELS
jgi:hypothetical protein